MHSLSFFRDRHAGEAILVCGCGSSLNQLADPERFVTIGVNDVGRKFQPDYLVVVNPRSQFKGDRFRYVETSQAKHLFTHLDLGVTHPGLVRFRLGQYAGTDLADPETLHYTRNSPYVAVCLAALMGARRIGLIGVDFTDHHFFAATGRHPLAYSINRINDEYKKLHTALTARGIEFVNLSSCSRLTALPKQDMNTFRREHTGSGENASSWNGRKVFFVHYRFLSCGDVFRKGLMHAAASLKLDSREAYWDDPRLQDKVEQFNPELLFVVHGRKFSRQWNGLAKRYPSAVWLLDEPYEVDDTCQFSRGFRWTFVNDASTLPRHENAHYLPTCYDPEEHFDSPEPRPFKVGFIGGANPRREQWLDSLVGKGLLDYVVGGPWQSPALRRICRSPNIPEDQTAQLYRQTRIVVNIFRQQHHYNRADVPATSLNPRVYEALACGSLVVSERRSELEDVFPELPSYDEAPGMVEHIERLLQDENECKRRLQSCRRQLGPHTYQNRLLTVMNTCLAGSANNSPAPHIPVAEPNGFVDGLMPQLDGWRESGHVASFGSENVIRLCKPLDDAPGSEQGLSSRDQYEDVELAFELLLHADTRFIAKVHHVDPTSHRTNSYHLCSHAGRTYLARHNQILSEFKLKNEYWHSVRFSREGGTISVTINDQIACRVRDFTLPRGYAFVGVKGGEALMRNLRVSRLQPTQPSTNAPPVRQHELRYDRHDGTQPRVSIVTTVYDRVECLRRCLCSVSRLHFQEIEHIVVSDCPGHATAAAIEQLVKTSPLPRFRYANLIERANDWGISPAGVGLFLSRGNYVAFLSDDNGYAQDHFAPLVALLDSDPTLGFVYSSCMYDGRLVLRNCPPRPGGIDLGQPLFRRGLFDKHLGGTLPFKIAGWDWQMINQFINHGVQYRHLDRPTFIFRLAKYPQFLKG